MTREFNQAIADLALYVLGLKNDVESNIESSRGDRAKAETTEWSVALHQKVSVEFDGRPEMIDERTFSLSNCFGIAT